MKTLEDVLFKQVVRIQNPTINSKIVSLLKTTILNGSNNAIHFPIRDIAYRT